MTAQAGNATTHSRHLFRKYPVRIFARQLTILMTRESVVIFLGYYHVHMCRVSMCLRGTYAPNMELCSMHTDGPSLLIRDYCREEVYSYQPLSIHFYRIYSIHLSGYSALCSAALDMLHLFLTYDLHISHIFRHPLSKY